MAAPTGEGDGRVTYTGRPRASSSGSRPVSGRPVSGKPTSARATASRPVSGRPTRPLSGRSTATAYSGVDVDDVENLRQKYVLLEGDRRAYYETSQWTMKQNQQTVLALKKENRELKKRLSSANSKRDAGKTPFEKEITVLEKKVHELRTEHDKLVRERTRGGEKQARVKENLQLLEKDRSKLLETDNPALRSIRSLENRLDKAMVKQNEAASIGKTYEGIVARLREERLTFDAQLKAVEEAVRGKAVDLEQLNSMSNEAQLAKEAAMSELRSAHATVERERAHRAKELEERRAQVERAEMLAAEESGGADNPTRLAAVATYDEAFRRVQEEAGVVSLQEFVDRFLGQPSMRADLKAMESDTALRIENLSHKVEALKEEISELRFMGSASTATRAEMDSLQEAIKRATKQLEAAKAEQERLTRHMIDVKAGLAHLQEMLQGIPKAKVTISSDVKGNEVVDQLLHCGDKMAYAVDTVGRDPHALQALAQLRDDPSCIYDPTASPEARSPQATSPGGRNTEGNDEDDYGDDAAPVSLAKMLESSDSVLGLGASMSSTDLQGGVTKSVVLQRDILKKASAKWLDGK